MTLLLDECVDWRFGRELSSFEVRSVRELGWSGKTNGELLRLAEKQFDAFITVDRNLSYPRNAGRFNLAIVVLRARTNRLADLRALVPELLRLLAVGLKPGQVRIVGA